MAVLARLNWTVLAGSSQRATALGLYMPARRAAALYGGVRGEARELQGPGGSSFSRVSVFAETPPQEFQNGSFSSSGTPTPELMDPELTRRNCCIRN